MFNDKPLIRLVYLATSAIWESFMLSSLFLSSSSSSMMSNTLSTPCKTLLETFQKNESSNNHLFNTFVNEVLREMGQLPEIAVLAPHTLNAEVNFHCSFDCIQPG